MKSPGQSPKFTFLGDSNFSTVKFQILCMCRMSYFPVNMEHFLIKSSLYTDVLFFCSVISSMRAKRGHENERRARERKIKNVCKHLWAKKGFIKSLPHVNALSLSPPRSQYIFFFPHHYPIALAVNKFISYHARLTDFEEKIDGL